MKKQTFIGWIVLCLFSCFNFGVTGGGFFVPAKAIQPKVLEKMKPKLNLVVDIGKPKYLHHRSAFPCSNGLNHGGGCTRVAFYLSMKDFQFSSDGSLTSLTLYAGIRDVEVEISSEKKKGSCMFDLVLKHELTHLALHRAVLKKYAYEISKAVLARIEKFSPPMNQVYMNELDGVLEFYLAELSAEDERQNALMDNTSTYKFQQMQCLE